jgi:hypothetical protein
VVRPVQPQRLQRKQPMSKRKQAVLDYAKQHAGEDNLVAMVADFDEAHYVGEAKTEKQRKTHKRVITRWLKGAGLI